MEVINVNDNRRLKVLLSKEAEQEIGEIAKNATAMKLVYEDVSDECSAGTNITMLNYPIAPLKKNTKYFVNILNTFGLYSYSMVIEVNGTDECISSKYNDDIYIDDNYWHLVVETDNTIIIKLDKDTTRTISEGYFKVQIYELGSQFVEQPQPTIQVPTDLNKVFCEQFVADSIVLNNVETGLYAVKLTQTVGDHTTYSNFTFDFKYESNYGAIFSPFFYDNNNDVIVALKGEYSVNSKTLTLTLINTQGVTINSPTNYHVDIFKVG